MKLATSLTTLVCLLAGALPASGQSIQNRTGSIAAPSDGFHHPRIVREGPQVYLWGDEVLHVYERGHAGWTEVQRIAAEEVALKAFGRGLARDGDDLLIGGQDIRGPVLAVFRRAAEEWTLSQTLSVQGPWLVTALDASGGLGAMVTSFGGGPIPPVTTFLERAAGLWRTAPGTGPVAGDFLGPCISVEAGTVAIGASGEGAVYLYERRDAGFVAVDRLTADDPQQNGMGTAVLLRGDMLLAAGPWVPPITIGFPCVYEFARSGDSWRQVGTLVDPDVHRYQDFGARLEWLDDTRLLVSQTWWGHPNPSLWGASVFVREGARAWRLERRLAPTVSASFAGEGDDVLATPGRGELLAFDLSAPLEPARFCRPLPSPAGCQATLSWSGTPSAGGAEPFRLAVDGADGQRTSLVLLSRSLPTWSGFLGGGYPCLTGPFVRTGLSTTGGRAGACDGSFGLDFSAWMAGHPGKAPVPGEQVYLQGWVRTATTYYQPAGSVHSDAVSLTVQP